MSLLYAVVFASRCRSNHHRLAVDALAPEDVGVHPRAADLDIPVDDARTTRGDERKRVEMRFAHLKIHNGFERMRLAVRRECLQTELLELELQRRRALAGSAQAAALELGPMSFEPAGLLASGGDH